LASGSFVYRDLGSNSLKGVAEPVRAWQPIAESDADSRFEAATIHGIGERDYHYGATPQALLALTLIFRERVSLDFTGREILC
jgi:hypothetical protein